MSENSFTAARDAEIMKIIQAEVAFAEICQSLNIENIEEIP